MEQIIKVSKDIYEMAQDLAVDLVQTIDMVRSEGRKATVALSGGNTPRHFFSVLGNKYRDFKGWHDTLFFWSDERCVPPGSKESNYGTVREAFFDKADIPSENIHRIMGEADPELETGRYSSEILENVALRNGIPRFDIIYLGLGNDGHTASIFPGNLHLFNSSHICEVAVHPATGQKRITLTGPVINNASRVILAVAGRDKAEIVAEILENQTLRIFPASFVKPSSGRLFWHLDLDAASLLTQFA